MNLPVQNNFRAHRTELKSNTKVIKNQSFFLFLMLFFLHHILFIVLLSSSITYFALFFTSQFPCVLSVSLFTVVFSSLVRHRISHQDFLFVKLLSKKLFASKPEPELRFSIQVFEMCFHNVTFFPNWNETFVCFFRVWKTWMILQFDIFSFKSLSLHKNDFFLLLIKRGSETKFMFILNLTQNRRFFRSTQHNHVS